VLESRTGVVNGEGGARIGGTAIGVEGLEVLRGTIMGWWEAVPGSVSAVVYMVLCHAVSSITQFEGAADPDISSFKDTWGHD